ncbi:MULTISPECIES: phosphopantetheine-binding protein [Oligella]|uniref:Carrier domain-containing protein n=2 Tax=Oligella urethralis TaxID=90245 RepID=A0A095Z913_9BURK|nr:MULTISPECIES: phosphopantetheine-binding protein [Oligella]AVL70585.1 hypothetical protein CEQ07_03540 [Oligella urethralis]KGF31163.1 hypothetical protein HMPREF2130_04215 [Oligella urethralis DNF00040]OFV48245.1 hypothetical protein HMPREF3179_06585 [Oligella sp. HMSC09E12]PMC15381.1 hypothetical protein CJ230_11195 [Oligella urethralis]WOS36831.1 hypothetical protein RP300_00362 [Oligella urethralis]
MSTLTLEELTQYVQEIMAYENSLDPNENLIIYGLDSIRIMQIATYLKQKGITIEYLELAKAPILNEWWQLIKERI